VGRTVGVMLATDLSFAHLEPPFLGGFLEICGGNGPAYWISGGPGCLGGLGGCPGSRIFWTDAGSDARSAIGRLGRMTL